MSIHSSVTSDQPRLIDEPAPTITVLRPCEDDPNLREIHVGGECRMVVRASDLEELNITVGQAWTDDLDASLAQRAECVRARAEGLRLLGRRAYSSAQLRKKLAGRFGADAAGSVVGELKADGWIDDDAFARELIESVLRRGPAGEAMLRDRLHRAGLRPADHQPLIAEYTDDHTTIERAAAYLARQAADSILDRAVLIRRLRGRLARRGIDYDLIARALHTAGLDAPDPHGHDEP